MHTHAHPYMHTNTQLHTYTTTLTHAHARTYTRELIHIFISLMNSRKPSIKVGSFHSKSRKDPIKINFF